MKSTVLILALGLTSMVCLAQSRFVTLTVNSFNQTNQLTIQDFEVAKLKSAADPSGYFQLFISKGSDTYSFYGAQLQGSVHMDGPPYIPPLPVMIAGPATLSLVWGRTPAFATFEILPESFPPNQTLVVPPGTNQVAITMQTSTNLVQWDTATNGIYGGPDTVRFFRIKMDKVN